LEAIFFNIEKLIEIEMNDKTVKYYAKVKYLKTKKVKDEFLQK